MQNRGGTPCSRRYPQRRAGACSRRFVGKGYFAYGKSQRVLRRSHRRCRSSVLHRVASVDCYNSLELARLPQQNFATLRMTYSRFAFCVATYIVANYRFCEGMSKIFLCCDARRGATQFARIQWDLALTKRLSGKALLSFCGAFLEKRPSIIQLISRKKYDP